MLSLTVGLLADSDGGGCVPAIGSTERAAQGDSPGPPLRTLRLQHERAGGTSVLYCAREKIPPCAPAPDSQDGRWLLLCRISLSKIGAG